MLPFLTKVRFNALPRRVFDRDIVKDMLNILDDHAVKIFPLKEKRVSNGDCLVKGIFGHVEGENTNPLLGGQIGRAHV